MAFEVGNKFWEVRSSHGRNPIFKTPEELWDACCEYFQWVQDNPLWESEIVKAPKVEITEVPTIDPKSKKEKIVKSKTTIPYSIVELPKMRAMTISGLCLFLDIDNQTWANYRKKEDFFGIISRAEKVIFNQKFAGAAADLLNANLIARELGLADKKEVTTDPDKQNEIDYSKLSDEELQTLRELTEKAKKNE